MKKLFLVLSILIMMAMSVSAQVPAKPFSVYGGAGLDLVSANDTFKEFHKVGYNLSGGVGFSIMPMVQLVGKVEYHSVIKDWDLLGFGGINLSDYVEGGRVGIMTFGPDVRFTIGAPMVPIKPFLLAGFGWASISEGDITILDANFTDNIATVDDGTKFYFNVGGGLEFGSGPAFKFFFQVRYLNIKQDVGDNIAFIPVSLGLKF